MPIWQLCVTWSHARMAAVDASGAATNTRCQLPSESAEEAREDDVALPESDEIEGLRDRDGFCAANACCGGAAPMDAT